MENVQTLIAPKLRWIPLELCILLSKFSHHSPHPPHITLNERVILTEMKGLEIYFPLSSQIPCLQNIRRPRLLISFHFISYQKKY